MAMAARASVAWLAKYCGEHSINADSSEKIRKPSFSSRSAGPGRAARRSSKDVPCGRETILLPPFGDLTTSWRGTLQFPPSRDRDCSGDKLQFLRKRVSRYTAGKRQNGAYQPALSASFSSRVVD